MTEPADDPGGQRARSVAAVLRAVATMARRSVRAQADVDAALRKFGMELPEPVRREILGQLAEDGLVENLIPLSDGAILLTVTPKGLLAGRG